MEDQNSELINKSAVSGDEVMVINVVANPHSSSKKKKKKKKSKKQKHIEKLLSKVSSKNSRKFQVAAENDKICDENFKIQFINDKFDASTSNNKHKNSNSQQSFVKNRTHSAFNSEPSYRSKSPNNSSRNARGDNKSSNTNSFQTHSHENHDFTSDSSHHFNNSHIPYMVRAPTDHNFIHQKVEYLSNQLQIMTQENLRLNDRLYNHNWDVLSDSEVDIVFKKRELSKKFSGVIKRLVSDLISGRIAVEELDKFCTEHSKEKSNSPEPDCLFAVDCSAEVDVSVPRYDSSFQELLEKSNEANCASSQKPGRIPQACFNCEEDHHLNECQYPFDYQRISFNKRQRQRSFVSSKRYHLHGRNESNFKPGVISDELREALNLAKDQIPLYVYRMRLIDYPPGWLQHAAVESSGITLYDSEGNADKINPEAGEVDPFGVKIQYDPDKLIDYPGFNIPLPPNFIDESFELGLPSQQAHQLRCFREKNMVKPVITPSRKRPLISKDDKPAKVQRVEEDMEVEDQISSDESVQFVSEFVPPLPEATPPPPSPPPPPPPPPDEELEIVEEETVEFEKLCTDAQSEDVLSAVDLFKITSCDDISGSSSPSLDELEEIKKKLKMQLGLGVEEDMSGNTEEDEEDSCTVVEEVSTLDDKASEESYIVEEEFIASENSGLSSISDSSLLLNKPEDSPAVPEPLERTESKSKLVSLGTPSVSRHSSFSKLPDYEKFSQNVSSHLPFENLPNSTGTYSRLKNVLKKVKVTLNNLMQ